MGASSTSERDDFGTIEAPTESLVVAPVGDRCASCGAPLASDQRYCVVCGERRGKARYPLAQPAAETATVLTGPPRRPRLSSGSTFIAGIGVLLLAMGLGVLIGRIGHQTAAPRAAAQSPVQVVTLGGGSGQSTAASTTPSTTASSGKSSGTKVKKVLITKQIAAKATQAASKVLGGSTNLAPPTASQGSKCSSGAGCQSGSFTGNFFGQ